MAATAPFLVPHDLKTIVPKVTLHRGMGDRCPNLTTASLALLWKRYMPAHDSKELLRDDQSPLGCDFSPIRAAEIAAGTKPSKINSRVKQAGEKWAGYGAIDWFVKSADAVRAKSLGKLLAAVLLARRRAVFATASVTTFLHVKAHGRCAIGLGNAAPFENSGITLHQTYGFPVLHGDSVKGLARHYLVEEFSPHETNAFPVPAPSRAVIEAFPLMFPKSGEPSAKHRWELAEALFGGVKSSVSSGDDELTDEDDDDVPDDASDRRASGLIDFHDGWPAADHTPQDGWFDVDVLTVHHHEYYAEERKQADDTENPIPVHFLTLRPGVHFEIPLCVNPVGRRMLTPDQQSAHLEFVQHLLQTALSNWGIGAKTGAGYGRFVSVISNA